MKNTACPFCGRRDDEVVYSKRHFFPNSNSTDVETWGACECSYCGARGPTVRIVGEHWRHDAWVGWCERAGVTHEKKMGLSDL